MARTGFARKDGNGATAVMADLKPSTSGFSASTSPARGVQPTPEQVRVRAYEVYQSRTKAGRPGDPTTDWLEAEQQLRTGSTPPRSPHSGQ